MDGPPELPLFDPNYCLKVAKWTASVCVAVLVVEVLALIVIGPNDSRCPGWIFNAGKQSATSFWYLVGFMTGLPTLGICYVVVRWDHFSRKLNAPASYYHSSALLNLFGSRSKSADELARLNFEHMFLMDRDWLFLRVSILWCVCCTIPLWMILGACTDLPRLIETWSP